MSTNYYWNPEGTNFAKRFPGKLQLVHIGKTSGGQQFSFQGYSLDIKEVTVDLGGEFAFIMPFEFKLELRSWKQWQEFIKEHGGTIQSEYHVTLTLEEFQKLVEEDGPNALPGKRGRNHHDEVLKNYKHEFFYKDYLDPNKCWKDPEGYSFKISAFF